MLNIQQQTRPASKANSHLSDSQDAMSIEFARLDKLFAKHLYSLRQRGRSPLGDAVGGAVIEEGEAEGLLASLHETHCTLPEDVIVPETWTSPLTNLEHTRELFHLLPAERDILLLALAVEVDSRYARLVAFLNDHVAMTRPTVGLAMALLLPNIDAARTALLRRLVANGPLLTNGLLELEGEGPVANRTIRVPDNFWPRLIGIETETRFSVIPLNKIDFDAYETINNINERITSVAVWRTTQHSDQLLIFVSGFPGSGRDTIAQQVAAKLKPNAITIDARRNDISDHVNELVRESRWHNACVIVRHAESLSPEAHQTLQRLIPMPLIYVRDNDKGDELLEKSNRPFIEIAIPAYDYAARSKIWQCLTSGYSESLDATALASRFGFGPGRIKNAIRLAETFATSAGGNQIKQSDLELTCRRMQGAEFGQLAQKLPCPFAVNDIILPEKTSAELDLICTWAKHGAGLFNEQGIGRNLNTGKGLVCLFSGPPGTGKTMAAQVIGQRIGYDVYRIDLSQVVNKYIGETEKNLSRVFNEAQRSKVILFFDEAETLYGDRSEVKSAQDRFANIEIGYLLQRIETFEGVAILATNLQKNLDEAFLRRLSITANFPVPEAAERFLIWNKLLPPESQRDNDLDIEMLSKHFKIAGGDIRNAIFSALLLAAEDQSRLGMKHLVRGLWRELQKSGRIVDMSQFGNWQKIISGIS